MFIMDDMGAKIIKHTSIFACCRNVLLEYGVEYGITNQLL